MHSYGTRRLDVHGSLFEKLMRTLAVSVLGAEISLRMQTDFFDLRGRATVVHVGQRRTRANAYAVLQRRRRRGVPGSPFGSACVCWPWVVSAPKSHFASSPCSHPNSNRRFVTSSAPINPRELGLNLYTTRQAELRIGSGRHPAREGVRGGLVCGSQKHNHRASRALQGQA
jgi:hypothetical protein